MARQLPREIRYAEHQPAPGETILKCAHGGTDERRWHWFRYEALVPFRRPDGTQGESRWLCICSVCLGAFREPQQAIATDFQWEEDGPLIVEATQ